MDWAGAIAKNRDDLIEIVTRLFVLAGIRTGVVVAVLPRGLRLRLLAMLRPAEYATRRLIAMAACKLVTVTMRPASPLSGGRKLASESRQARVGARTADRGDLSPPPGSAAPSATRPVCISDLPARGRLGARHETPRPTGDGASGASLPAFALFDPFKRYGSPWLEPGDPDGAAEVWRFEARVLPDEPVDVKGICRRIRALERALQDLEGQAVRLARWRARANARPRRFSPMRPGRPPGWRRHPKTRLELVLDECHFLARDAWNSS